MIVSSKKKLVNFRQYLVNYAQFLKNKHSSKLANKINFILIPFDSFVVFPRIHVRVSYQQIRKSVRIPVGYPSIYGFYFLKITVSSSHSQNELLDPVFELGFFLSGPKIIPEKANEGY